MNAQTPQSAIGSVKGPRTPQEVLEAGGLSDVQKAEILENWKLDLLERQRASDENMPNSDPKKSGRTGESLRKVIDALAQLRRSDGKR